MLLLLFSPFFTPSRGQGPHPACPHTRRDGSLWLAWGKQTLRSGPSRLLFSLPGMFPPQRNTPYAFKCLFKYTLCSEVTLVREVFPDHSAVNCRAAHSTASLTCTLVYQFILKDDIKDTDEQTDEEVHRQGSEGSQAQKLLSL